MKFYFNGSSKRLWLPAAPFLTIGGGVAGGLEGVVDAFSSSGENFCNLFCGVACLSVNDTESLDKPSSRFLSPPDVDTAASGVFCVRRRISCVHLLDGF